MSAQGVATSLLLPPMLLVLASLGVLLLPARCRRAGAWLAGLCLALLLFLATPFAAGHLRSLLEEAGTASPFPALPQAVIILSAEAARDQGQLEPGPMTLERLLAGVRLARRTGLPVLVTGGALAPGEPPIATAMARVLAEDFRLPPRWIEPEASDTRSNAQLSAAMLRRDGIAAAYVVTHAWHMRRALGAFARTGLAAVPAPVRLDPVPKSGASDWVPSPTQWGVSWFMLREWAGILVYRLRDGPAMPRQ